MQRGSPQLGFPFGDRLARKLGGTDNPIRLPFCVEKNGVRYSCDIADDAEGVDWVITKA